ncbi:hypothetical protein GQS_02280 [Thermococcus sp. 4557]|uniref:hypothetical protein n=1 Tax=Thermococcus sp. (strain CGMCC 1.5172 / 4557) TaxID=1042877 RepID=UPI000219EDC1|nr:hypothetical protein [Thermococcus sp. 4557]AEK72357.1 hypothetical protein GQS_02280 [Thermococcus sp. 4557]
MERLKSTLLQKRLEVVKKRKELLALEEARLVRMARQKKAAASELAKVKKEKVAIALEEAKLIRVLKQSGYPAV